MIELIDSHCHLHYEYGSKTPEDIVNEANAAGVSALITVGTDLPALAGMVAISEKIACVYHTVGVHPHEASTLVEGDLDRLRIASKHPKCRAIGEIGLDYHYDHSPRDIQIREFETQLNLAIEVGLPVVIHARDAEDDLLKALTHYSNRVPTGKIPGVIHCFSGTKNFGEKCIELGFYISFSGILTFKTAEDLRVSAKAFPLDRLLVETDSPYLAPIPYRGKKCEPSMVKLTAQKLAEVKGISLEEVALATVQNTRKVFKI